MSDEQSASLPAGPGRSYLGDGPVHTEAEDEFGRYPFARALAESIASQRDDDCMVIGLYAPWGAGKTSVLNFLESELKADSRLILLRFNPWRYPTEEELLRQFYDSFARALKKAVLRLDKRLAGLVSRFLKLTGDVAEVPSVRVGKVAKALAAMARDHSQITIDEAKARVQEFLDGNRRRVVVLVDDLDRLEPSEAHAMLRLVRLNADFPRTTYVIAADADMVAEALSQRFNSGLTDSGDVKSGRSFLEKIVQVPLHLPPCDPTAIRLVFERGLNEAFVSANVTLEGESRGRLSTGVIKFLWPDLTTPRMVKRFVNAVRFHLLVTSGEVNAVDLLLLEGIRLLYPEIYPSLTVSRALLLGGEEDAIHYDPGDTREVRQNRLEQLLKSIPGDRRERAKGLLALLFPHVRSLVEDYVAPDQPDPEWIHARRVCTHEYFARHFASGVPRNDIGDRAVDDFARFLVSEDFEAAEGWLKSIGDHVDQLRLLNKLERAMKGMQGDEAAKVALGVARLGHEFSTEEGSLFFSPQSMAAGVVADLLQRVPERGGRLACAIAVINEPIDLSFAVRVFDQVAVYEEEKRTQAPFSSDEQEQLFDLLVERLERSPTGVLAVGDQHLARVLWAWGRTARLKGPTAWLERACTENPDILDKVLLSFAGEAWEMDSGRRRRTLSQTGFEQLTDAIEAEVVARLIGERFGEALIGTSDEHWAGDEVSSAPAVAKRFLEMLRLRPDEKVPDGHL